MKNIFTLILGFVLVSFGFAQHSSIDASLKLASVKKQGVFVITPFVEPKCKKKRCDELREKVNDLKTAIKENFTFCPVEFAPEYAEKSKDRNAQEDKFKNRHLYILKFSSNDVTPKKTVGTNDSRAIGSANASSIHSKISGTVDIAVGGSVYAHQFYLLDKPSGQKRPKFLKKDTHIAGFYYGKSNYDAFSMIEELGEYLPVSIKVFSQYLEDCYNYKTTTASKVAEMNAKAAKIETLYIFRGHVRKFLKKPEKIKSQYDVNLKFVGIDDIIDILNNPNYSNSAIAYPTFGVTKNASTQDHITIIQGGTKKMLGTFRWKSPVVTVTGPNFSYFHKKINEEINAHINSINEQ